MTNDAVALRMRDNEREFEKWTPGKVRLWINMIKGIGIFSVNEKGNRYLFERWVNSEKINWQELADEWNIKN